MTKNLLGDELAHFDEQRVQLLYVLLEAQYVVAPRVHVLEQHLCALAVDEDL